MSERGASLFDSLTLAAVAGEIRASVGARFAGVRQTDPETVVLGLGGARTVGHLLCCISPRAARVHFTSRPLATERLTPFGTLLRSRLVDARLSAVAQPPFNRVLALHFAALEGPLRLVAEVMGPRSNLILADDQVVLGALKVVTAQMSPRRPVLPGRPYIPPPLDRPTPDAIDAEGVRAALAGELSLATRLTQALLGVSPLMAREIALRAGLDPAMPAAAAAAAAGRIYTVLREIAADVVDGRFAPTVYREDGRVAAFAPFPMRALEGLAGRAARSMSEAIDEYFRGAGEGSDLEDRRRSLSSAAGAALQKRETALQSSRHALAQSEEAERYRIMGDLLLTYASKILPRSAELRVPDYTAGGAELTIALDPALTPSENAQRYFRRYAKARAALRAIPARIAHLEREADALRDALVQIGAAASTDDLWEIQTDLVASHLLARAPRTRPAARTGPRRFQTADGATILIGRSARENDRITFRDSGPEDLWFHARGLPGAHVILKSGRAATEASITAAAQAAAYYSAARQAREVAVVCVARKHVHKPKGAPPGAVTVSGERTLLVTPALPGAERNPRAAR